VIVGAGSAGAVLANRLSENGRHSVLLLEAGARSHHYSFLPASFGLLIQNPAANWCYTSQPEANTAHREIPVPRGKLLGGSSAINGLVYVRGQPLDYDIWAQRGNRGWSYDDVLPYFQRLEYYESCTPDSVERGITGPQRVSQVDDQNPLYDAWFAAARELNLPVNPDYNSRDQFGVAKTQTTISRGRRASTAASYLKPARRRRNLRIEVQAQVEKLTFNGTRCTGLEYRQRDRLMQVTARREVIVCAGGIASPQLLELSGIGSPDLLKAQGIAPVHSLPAVGENLRDHINARLCWKITAPNISYNDRLRGLRRYWQGLKYFTTGGGFLSLPSAPLVAFLKTQPDMENPDVQLHLVPYSVEDPKKRKMHKQNSKENASFKYCSV